MTLQLLVIYGISDLFAVVCTLIFTKRRYSLRSTVLAMAMLYLAVLFLECLRYWMFRRGHIWRFTMNITIVLGLAVELAVSEYRDSRAVFTGLMSASYIMFGNMTMKLLLSLHIPFPAVIVVGVSLHVALLVVLVRFLLPYYRSLQSVYRPEWRLLGLIMLMLCLGMFLLYNCLKGDGVTILHRIVPLVYLACVYFLVILAFQMLGRLNKREMEDRDQKILQAGMSALKREVDELRRAEERISSYNRDSRCFVSTISGMMEKKDYEGVEKALAGMQAMPAVTDTKRYCRNLPLNGVAAYYIRMAEDHRIHVEVRLEELPKDLGESSWELATVIGNLLDNAVQAASAVEPAEDRKLCIQGRESGGQILFEIRNVFAGTIKFDKLTDLPLSTKGEGHGLGMQSVAGFVKRQGGALDCGVEGQWFYVRMLI